jgi:predicted Zn-dependent peptidase
MLRQVLDALTEVAFEPEFLPSRIEKERKAVVAEAQMMNTIEYRVDCQLLQYLHWENALGCRFPIGKTEQVEQWGREEIMAFWARHYFPANATLYVVGDVDVQVCVCVCVCGGGGILPAENFVLHECWV